MTTTPTSPVSPVSPETPAPAPEDALRAAKPPVGSGPTPLVAQVVAVLVIALGVVGVQEALARTGIVTTSWTSWVLTHLAGRTADFSVLVGSVVLALVGLALLVLVVRPRPRKTLTLDAHTGVYLRTGDLARIVQSRVDGAEGVTDVDTTSQRSRLSVGVRTIEPAARDAELEADVRARLEPVFAALTNAPRLDVEITHQDLT